MFCICNQSLDFTFSPNEVISQKPKQALASPVKSRVFAACFLLLQFAVSSTFLEVFVHYAQRDDLMCNVLRFCRVSSPFCQKGFARLLRLPTVLCRLQQNHIGKEQTASKSAAEKDMSYLTALYDRFRIVTKESVDLKQEVSATHEALHATLNREQQKLLLRLIDAEDSYLEQQRLDSFVSGLRLSDGIRTELDALTGDLSQTDDLMPPCDRLIQ